MTELEKQRIRQARRVFGGREEVDIHLGSLGIYAEDRHRHRRRAAEQRAHGRGGTVRVTHVDRNAGTIIVEGVE